MGKKIRGIVTYKTTKPNIFRLLWAKLRGKYLVQEEIDKDGNLLKRKGIIINGLYHIHETTISKNEGLHE